MKELHTQPAKVTFRVDLHVNRELHNEITTVLPDNIEAADSVDTTFITTLNVINAREQLTKLFDKLVNDTITIVYTNTGKEETLSPVQVIEKTETLYHIALSLPDNYEEEYLDKLKATYQAISEEIGKVVEMSKNDLTKQHHDGLTKLFTKVAVAPEIDERLRDYYLTSQYRYCVAYYVESKGYFLYTMIPSHLPLSMEGSYLEGLYRIHNLMVNNPQPYKDTQGKAMVNVILLEYDNYGKFLKNAHQLKKYQDKLMKDVIETYPPNNGGPTTNDVDETIPVKTWWKGNEISPYQSRVLEHSLLHHRKPYLIIKSQYESTYWVYIDHTLTVDEAAHLQRYFTEHPHKDLVEKLSFSTIVQRSIDLTAVEGDGILVHNPHLKLEDVKTFIDENIINKKVVILGK